MDDLEKNGGLKKDRGGVFPCTQHTPGWSGAVIAPLRAYPFLNFLGFKIRTCDEGPCTLINVCLAPKSGHGSAQRGMSALCQKLTHAPQQKCALFDRLVGE
jgi:hypothetical protein